MHEVCRRQSGFNFEINLLRDQGGSTGWLAHASAKT